MPDIVPYQAYISKRHSNTPSNPYLVPNVSPPPISRPSSIARSPSPQLNRVSLDKEKDSIAASAFANSNPSELESPHPVIVVGPEQTNGNRTPSLQETSNTSLQDTASHTTHQLGTLEQAGHNEPPTLLNKSMGPFSPTISQAESSASSSHHIHGKRTSTFRRVPLRNARLPVPSSPLSPNQSIPSHSRSVSVSSTASSKFPFPQAPSTSSPVPIPTERSLLSIFPEPFNKLDDAHTHQSTSSFDHAPPPSTLSQAALAVSSSNDSSASTPPIVASEPSKPPQRRQAPYRPGFQPKGLYRQLTDDFVAIRRQKREGTEDGGTGSSMKRVEQTKLSRRLQKLIDLHFSDGTLKSGNESNVERSSSGGRKRPAIGVGGRDATITNNRRASSFFDLDIRNLSISDAGGLWRGVVGGGKVHDIRAAEQRITPWQDDAEVTKCPLCATSFHPLTNRKHHCRLCGQIICALPVKFPQRPTPCSLLFVVDPKTRKIEEVGEGVDYGVRRRRADSMDTGKEVSAQEDKFLKGVRICRSCRPILLRRQYQQEVIHVPLIVQLYEVFIGLEHEIEESLSRFQELVLNISQNDHPPKEASATRKRLLEAFAQYDALAKRIRKLPCPNGPGSSQDRVQMAVMTRANLFLQKNMFPLQSLSIVKETPTKLSTQLVTGNGDDSHHIDPDSKIAFALQPLLEQEALLESFVDEAQAQRKFEDLKTLKANLVEIRSEIEKIALNVEEGMQNEAAGS